MVRVLLVEDSHDMLTMIAEILKLDDHDVIEAVNGREALEVLQSATELPQIIMSDVKMPIMDGWQLLAHIRAEPALSSLPVVILSGDVNDRDLAFENGANAFLLKPFRQADMAKVLHELLG